MSTAPKAAAHHLSHFWLLRNGLLPLCSMCNVPARPSPPWQCDVTGVGATMCRHSLVAQLFDIATGERYIYASVMLYCLLVVHCISVTVFWYDINCKFGSYFLRWAAAHPQLVDALGRASRIRFPLPCFHRHGHRWGQGGPGGCQQAGTGCRGSCALALERALRRPSPSAAFQLASCLQLPPPSLCTHPLHTRPHPHPHPTLSCSAACQERNDGLYVTGTGRHYNEPCETLWAHLGVLGVASQYMTHRNRRGRLERGAQLYNQRLAARIVPRLGSMQAAAETALESAMRSLAAVRQQLADHHGVDEEQVGGLGMPL